MSSKEWKKANALVKLTTLKSALLALVLPLGVQRLLKQASSTLLVEDLQKQLVSRVFPQTHFFSRR